MIIDLILPFVPVDLPAINLLVKRPRSKLKAKRWPSINVKVIADRIVSTLFFITTASISGKNVLD
ncbi:hypothetical protein ACFLY3_02995 [Chloroflexota bacterium]